MKLIARLMEWIRPAGIGLVYFLAEYWGTSAVSKFHILGPFTVILMSGTVAFEALFLGEVASEKIGYTPNRAYQVQSGLNHLALAATALVVFVLAWGRYADATVTLAMLVCFAFSAINHAVSAIKGGNFKPVNVLRPLLALFLIGLLLPPMIKALQ